MWRLKQLMPNKDQAGLEGKTVEVGSLKLQVRSTIAEGGFSCVYLVRDSQSGKQYALKHIICNDGESLDLVKKEVAVSRSLRGHPNVVTLHAQTVYDLGRTKECFLVMEFCEKALVNVLESRGAAYFEEKQILLMFRDVCNAVYAMHCQMPPIAHRDLKAENVLMGADGAWKLCDFGSTSTNHKRFERPEEMGIEEDIIRKHTTPAYRAPEMWDLYRRELISEKVDIWALGCLLYRIAYLKSAFDGESKLQILNGNYRIPELPRYSSSLVELIKDMLTAAPEVRPDIMQIWHRVNELLPVELRKSSADRPLSMANSEVHAPPMDAQDHGNPVATRRTSPLPSRTPPPPPTLKDQDRQSPPMVQPDSKAMQGGVGSGSSLGAFWSSQYAQESVPVDDKGPVFDKDPGSESVFKQRSQSPETHPKQGILSSPKENQPRAGHILKSGMSNFKKKVHASPQPTTRQGYDEMNSDISQIRLSSEDTDHGDENTIDSGVSPVKASASEFGGPFHDDSFNAFVADFDNHKPTTGTSVFGKESLQVVVDRLKEELEQVRLEKAEITSKYEKLTAICRSQRQEIQELKQALSTASAPNFTTFSKEGSTKPVISQQTQVQQLKQQQKQRLVPGSWHSGNKQEDKIEGSIWELQEGMSTMSSHSVPFKVPDAKEWRPFGESQTTQLSNSPPTNVSGASNGYRPQHHASGSSVGSSDTRGFGQDSFTPVRNNVQASKSSGSESKGNPAVYDSYSSKSDGRSSRSITQSQPAGWAGF